MRRLLEGQVAIAVAAVALALVFFAPRAVAAGPAAEQFRGHMDRMLALLADPELRAEARSHDRRAAIRQLGQEFFDLAETTKRCLGAHWQGRTPAEREEVVRLFGDLLERSYLSKLDGYAGERMIVLGDVIDGDQAVVRTTVVTKQGTEIPVDYRMLRRGDRWVAYDVVIEGISLVANYRTQFNAIIRRSSFHELVRKLRDKQDERGVRRTSSPS